MRNSVRMPTTGGRLLLLLSLLLQRPAHRFTHKLCALFTHGSDRCIVGLIQPHPYRLLTERFLPLRDGVLMLPEVFYRSHALTRLHAIQANAGVHGHHRYAEALRSLCAWLLRLWI